MLPVLDQETHTYRLGNIVVPGVTEVLSPLVDFSMVSPDWLEYKSAVGTAVHRATELFDANDLDEDSVSDVLVPYLDAWIKFCNDTDFRATESEQLVYHPRYNYAGTLDRVGHINGDSDQCLIDIKTVAVLTPVVGVQLAAYQAALNKGRLKKDEINKRFAVQLKPDGTYRLERYSDKSDFNVFTGLLALHNWRVKHDKQYTGS